MFLFNDNSPISFRDALPDAVDAVVIGGGVIGISTAWYLRERGLSVLVCDKGRVAGEQSSRNWGWVRVTGRDEAEVPVALDSVRCWKEISEALDEDLGLKQGGVLALAESDAEMADCEAWMEVAAKYDMDTRLFSRSEVTSVVDVPTARWQGGMVTPSDCRAEPFKAVPAIARGLQQRGGLVRENCAVRTLDIEAGRVAGVVTEQGRVRAQSVICAAGGWANMFLSNLDIDFPQLVLRGTVVRTAAAPEIFSGAMGLKDVYLRRRQDGGYTVATGLAEHTIGANSFRYFAKYLPAQTSGSEIAALVGNDATQQSFIRKRWNGDEAAPYEKHRVLNPAPSRDALRIIRQRLSKRVPAFADIEFAETWAGMIDATPDIVPVIDAIESCPGLFLGAGFSGHGFGIGPGAGKVMANLVTNNDPGFDLTRFRFSRFSDGSKIVPGPAL